MSKFKKAQYVMANIGCNGPDCWVLARVVDIEDDDVIVELIDEQYREEETFSYIDLRLATNLDYIHTLSAEQMVKVFQDVYFHGNCDMCVYDKHLCGALDCDKGIIKWLNFPYDGWVVE